jgi:PAS domain S-box-containing protein
MWTPGRPAALERIPQTFAASYHPVSGIVACSEAHPPAGVRRAPHLSERLISVPSIAPPAGSAPVTAPLRVLSLEAGDLPTASLRHQPTLPESGFAWRACTLPEALEAVRGGEADCVLLDLDLPGSAGPDAVRAMAAAAPHVPVVVLSGAPGGEAALLAAREGAHDLVPKAEATPAMLGRAIRYAVERMRQQRELARRAAREGSLAELGRAAVAADDPGALVDRALGELRRALDADFTGLFEPLPGGGMLLRAGDGWPGGDPGSLTLPDDGGALFRVLASGALAVQEWDDQTPAPTPFAERGARACVAVPVPGRGGPAGVLVACSRTPGAFADGDGPFLEAAASVLGLAAERVRSEAASRELAGEQAARAQAEAVQRRFVELVQDLDAIVWEMDSGTGRFTFVSDHAEAVLGYPVREWLTDAGFWAAHIHPQDRAAALAFLRAAAERGTDHEFEYRMLAHDGRVVWVRDLVRAVPAPGGGAPVLRGVMVDVTALKRADASLAASEERFRTLAGSLEDVVFTLDRDLRHVGVFGRWPQRYGLTPAHFLGRPISQHFGPDASGVHEDAARRALRGEAAVYDWETRLGGRAVHFQTRMSPLTDASGAVVGVVGVGRDVTEQRLAERAVRESEERFRAVFRTSAVGIVLSGFDGRIERANPAFGAIVGREPAELARMPWIRLTHPDDVEPNLAYVREMERGLRDTFQLEKRYLRADGTAVWGRLSASAVRDAEGRPQHMVAMIEDVTEARRAREALEESQRFLRSTLDALASQIAILDERGVILEVNDAWRRFGESDGGTAPLEAGADYLAACGAETAAGIRGVLRGERDEFRTQYECGGPEGRRWFMMRVTHFAGPGPMRLVVSHIEVSERRRAEAALRESEERFRALVENLTDVISVMAPDGTLLSVSGSAVRTLGYDPADLEGRNAFDLVHPDDLETTRRVVAEAMADPGAAHGMEYRLCHAAGEWRVLESVITSLLDNPAVGGVVINSRDVTERNEAEAARRESEERFRSFFDHSIDAVLLTLATGPVVQANPAALRLFGYTEEEMLRTDRLQLTDPADPRVAEGMAHRQRTGSFRGEITLRRRDGSVFPGEIATAEFLGHDGVPNVSIVVRDATERNRAEAAARRMAAIVEASTDAIFGEALDGTVTSWNAGAERIYGWTAAEIVGTSIDCVVPPELRDESDSLRARAVAGERIVEHETVRLRRDGRRLRISLTVSPLVDERGVVAGIAAVARDVTGERQLQEQLRQAQKMEAVGRLAGGVAHDFNNLLTAISGNAEMLLMDMAPEDPLRADVEEIRAAGRRAAALTRQLLAFSRRRCCSPRCWT